MLPKPLQTPLEGKVEATIVKFGNADQTFYGGKSR
jgi:hypothetical protein